MNIAKIITASVAALTLGGVVATTAATAAPASASPHTVALENAQKYPAIYKVRATYRPGKFYIMYGGPNVFAKNLHWSYWSHGTASGSGTLYGQDEGTYNLGHVTLYFYDAQYSQSHGWYFEKLHVIGGQGVVHYWHWSKSGANWVG